MIVNQAIEEGRLVVLPTETTSRSFLTHFIKANPGRAVFADSVISWDTFKSFCTTLPTGLSPATSAHRLLFSYQYLGSLKTDSYFYNTSYPETLTLSARELSKSLPYMSKVENPLYEKHIEKSLLKEIKTILISYRDYLNQRGLYEENFLIPDYKREDIKEKRPLIVYPENITDPDVETAIAEGVEAFTPEEEVKTTIIRYPNSLFEIRATVEKIYSLLKDGKTDAEEIAITSARLDEIEPYLKSESSKYNIKLAFVKSRKLTDWASGSFFRKIYEIYSSDFDLQSVTSFLLDPAYPFKDRNFCAWVIRQAVDLKYLSGVQSWLYKTSADSVLHDFVQKFTDYVNGICMAKDAPSLRRALKGFQDDFFIEGSWAVVASSSQAKVFMVCMDTLDNLEEINVLPKGVSFYDFYLTLLSETYYAPGKAEEGIKVYKYPVSCPLAVKHHFIIGLDDESSRQYRTVLPFAEDMEEGSPLHKKNISEDICSSLNREGAVISFSEQTYSSYCIAPSFFEQCKLVEEAIIEPDRFSEEKHKWFYPESKIPYKALSSQKKAFERAEKTVFPFALGLVPPAPIKERGSKIRISSTSLTAFENCPFAFKCRYIDGIEETDFSVDEEDPIKIGEIIHNTYESYFREVKNVRDLRKPENQELLKKNFLTNLRNYAYGPKGPSALQIERIKLRYMEALSKISEVEDYAEFSESDMEYEFFFEEEGYYVKGRIDCIMKTPDGGYAVLDFKKREGDKKSLQLPLYAEGMKKDIKGKYNQYPSYAAFYGVEEKKNTVQWNNEQDMRACVEDFKTRAESAVSAIERGEFNPTPGQNNCANCRFRRICRMRYVIK